MSRRDSDQAQQEQSSADSDSNRSSSVTGPRSRPSRAGSRKVSTLSPEQLDRKRAHDREAQRAIRQRTKDKIEALERRIAELTDNPELVNALRRIKELEEENALLRFRLEQAGVQASPGERLGSWEGLSPTRPQTLHIQGPSMQLPGQQGEPSSLVGRREAQEQIDPYGYRPLHQWQTANPFHGEPPVKGESSPSPGPQISTHEYSSWPGDRSRVGSQPSRPGLPQPADYSHMIGSQPFTVPSTPAPIQPHVHLPIHPQGLAQYGSGPQQQYIQQGQSQQQPQQPQQDPSRTSPRPSRGSQQRLYRDFSRPP